MPTHVTESDPARIAAGSDSVGALVTPIVAAMAVREQPSVAGAGPQ